MKAPEEEAMRILLVDDEHEFVTTLATRLSLRGMAVEDVTSGQEAIDKARDNEYDVIIIDLKMAGIDGVETMRRIREINPQAKFIMLTGHCDETEIDRTIEAGAAHCLLKPINIDALVEKINQTAESGGTK